jgi:hypothetical protein
MRCMSCTLLHMDFEHVYLIFGFLVLYFYVNSPMNSLAVGITLQININGFIFEQQLLSMTVHILQSNLFTKNILPKCYFAFLFLLHKIEHNNLPPATSDYLRSS